MDKIQLSRQHFIDKIPIHHSELSRQHFMAKIQLSCQHFMAKMSIQYTIVNCPVNISWQKFLSNTPFSTVPSTFDGENSHPIYHSQLSNQHLSLNFPFKTPVFSQHFSTKYLPGIQVCYEHLMLCTTILWCLRYLSDAQVFFGENTGIK